MLCFCGCATHSECFVQAQSYVAEDVSQQQHSKEIVAKELNKR